MATWGHMSLLDSNSPVMEQLNFFHDHTLLILLLITISIGGLMISLLTKTFTDLSNTSGHTMEFFWTVIPAMVLIFVALPSLRMLYLLDELGGPSISIKAIGHQWFWSYEYPDFKNIEFDSYMIPTNELEMNGFRLLDVDNRVILPIHSRIRIIVSALDVLHSWTIPTLGVKVDATPGRLNQLFTYMNRSGLFFGQCSEICGANHSFMPIVVESVPAWEFLQWAYSKKN
uniref:Cytochrome c oxidase subunit 2 n=1 Tax=Culicoides cylindratus TaxID=469760 RepID=A8B0U2_9DIPT|nr:cytochrome c oxidase subunit II [Culicoides cylindratus]BAF80303.1 cytochrome c oxidase subunit II [Culicoides cylindratus]